MNTSRFATAQAKLGYNVSFHISPSIVEVDHSVKFIHTVRDSADAYVESWLKTADFADILKRLPFRLFERVRVMENYLYDQFRDGTTGDKGDKYLDKATLKAVYLQGIEGEKQQVTKKESIVSNSLHSSQNQSV